MKRCARILALLGVCGFAALVSGSGWAQQTQSLVISGEGIKSRYTQQLAIDVDDAPGHQVRVQESQRTYPENRQFMVEGERVTETWIRGFSNYTGGIGPAWGYQTWITEKGNKIFSEYSGYSEAITQATGSKRGTYHGTARIIGGTGRFAKIRGVLVDVAEFDTDPKTGYNRVDSHGQYWFEQ
jgi:hypothetical protein